MAEHTPGFWENLMLRIFSSVTWQVFRLPMNLVQLSWERHWREVNVLRSNDYYGAAVMLASSIPFVLYYSYQHPLSKTMDESSGDNEVIAFCKSEDSMAVWYIELVGTQTTETSIKAVLEHCPWMKVTKFKLSTSGEYTRLLYNLY